MQTTRFAFSSPGSQFILMMCALLHVLVSIDRAIITKKT